MPETVKAVTGLNLEYSRFSLPNKTNPISVASVSNPDCNCSPSDAQYQFPANWDTGPEKLDVFFYPRNYSGSDLSLFNGNQGLSRNIRPQYGGNTENLTSSLGTAYIEDPIENPYQPITLTKTENVFKDYPDIPKKRVSATTNTDLSFSVFHDTHLNISRKCWAGTGNLGGDEVLVIYSYSTQGLSIVVCYMNGASTECIHANDEAYGPHSVLLNLTPGTHFGSKSTFNTIESYFYNDSYYYSLDMGNILTYYTFTNSFNGYYNYWYGWNNNYGLDVVYSGYYGNYNYVNNNYYYNHKQTYYATYVKDAPLEGTSNWLCLSGRPQSVYHNIIDTSIPNWRQTTDEEKEEAISSFGTGVDSFSYVTVYWSTVGDVDAVAELRYNDCNGVSQLLQNAIPARTADEEPDWENPWVYANDNGSGTLTYSLSPLLAGWNYYYWNYYNYYNWYLRLTAITPYASGTIGNQVEGSDCYTYNYYNNNYYYGWNFNGYGPYSNGTWEINPAVPGAVAYACGTPVNEVDLDDGTTTYSVMELLSVNTVDVDWPRFGLDGNAYQAMINSHCTPSTNPCGNPYYTPYKQIGTIPSKYTRAVYKISTVNLPINLGVPYWTRITDDDQQVFPLQQVNKEYVTEPGYLRSTYYGSIEPTAKVLGRSNYSYFGDFCYAYGYDSIKYEVYPAASSGGSEEEPLPDELIVHNCNEYGNYYYNWYSATQRYLNLKFKAAYIPYFFCGVRPSDGLVYPANLTEPKVRIFSTDPPNPEEYRDSNYPKYYFQEFDPSIILISESKLLEVPPLTVTTPPTPNTKIYLPDYENATTKSTILPRATTMLQTVAEQTEYFQCEYLKGEFNDWYYYFPPSFLTVSGIDERLDFPENIYDCENNLTPTIPPIAKAAFLFDPNKGEDQLRSAGTSFNYYNYYNNLSISYLDYPEITAAIYNYQREAADEKKREYPQYLPAWIHVTGNMVYDYDYLPSSYQMPGMCSSYYGIKSIVMGGTDLCTPYTLTEYGTVSNCGTNLKKVEPEYSVMTGFAFYDAYDASRDAGNTAYEEALTRATYHSYPIPHEYKYITSYTATGDQWTGLTCTPNYTTVNYNWYIVLSDNVYTSNGGSFGGMYSNIGFTKSYYDITLPVWGRVSGLYWYGGYYNYWNPYGWPYNSIGGDTSFLDCEMVVADMGYTARKQELTGNNLSSNYNSWYYGGYNYYGYGNLQSLNISDIGGWGTSVTFTDAGALVKQNVPEFCGTGCLTPTASTDVFYFDLVPAGGNSFFRYYGYGYFGYSSWLTGEMQCQTLNSSGYCTTSSETVRLSPEFPELPPYNPCDPADYFWVEPCTHFSS